MHDRHPFRSVDLHYRVIFGRLNLGRDVVAPKKFERSIRAGATPDP